jgi:hypothetical protein
MTSLGPQFVYHGTARPIEGDQIVPAKVHGKGSYWGTTGSSRDEPAEDHAWAHPDEHVAWDAAMDRKQHHVIEEGAEIEPRARVFALHPSPLQTPGGDKSMAGELKAPHFDIAHPLDTMPGHQGTFPQVNWNEHVTHKSGEPRYLPGDEDANHPSDLSVQFGHNVGVWGEEAAHNQLHHQARDENTERSLERSLDISGKNWFRNASTKPDMLPGMSSDDRKYMRPRRNR